MSPPHPQKRPKVKGCYQCSRRRIDCDRQQPTCQKCQAKGLHCSGLGVRYRFNQGVASRGKLVGKQSAVELSYRRNALRSQLEGSLEESSKEPTHNEQDIEKITPTLSHIDGASLYMLQYFSDNIAPITTVIDRGFNGYRDLIVPLAENDPLVRRAIVLVSRQHLSLRFGAGEMASDLKSYGDLIRDLIIRSRSCPSSQDMSSMTALLLLHVREMISGSNDFKLLYGSLRALVNASAQTQRNPSQLIEFVNIQILRVRLFAEALFDETYGAEYLSTHGEASLEFLRYCRRLHPEHEELMTYLFSLIALARDIYIRRATDNPPPQETVPLIERFRQVTRKVKRYGDVIGQHLLAWAYFVVAAESSTQEHREFFEGELQSLYQATGCRSVLRGMEQIRKIWTAQPTTRWTSLLGGSNQAFIM